MSSQQLVNFIHEHIKEVSAATLYFQIGMLTELLVRL
jgi:hypothetical protein